MDFFCHAAGQHSKALMLQVGQLQHWGTGQAHRRIIAQVIPIRAGQALVLIACSALGIILLVTVHALRGRGGGQGGGVAGEWAGGWAGGRVGKQMAGTRLWSARPAALPAWHSYACGLTASPATLGMSLSEQSRQMGPVSVSTHLAVRIGGRKEE